MLALLLFTESVKSDLTGKIIEIVPSLLWLLLFVIVLVKLWRDQEMQNLLKKVTGIKGFGFELRFDEMAKSMNDAIAIGEKTSSLDIPKKDNKWNIDVPEEAGALALKRLKQHAMLFQNAHILWIDDQPRNNRNEIALLRELTAHVETVKSTEDALERLQDDDYDLILSDMSRGEEKLAGLDFLKRYREQSRNRAPVILYVGFFDENKGVPAGAFGITNRPDELIHLILDILERVKSK